MRSDHDFLLRWLSHGYYQVVLDSNSSRDKRRNPVPLRTLLWVPLLRLRRVPPVVTSLGRTAHPKTQSGLTYD